MTRLKALGQTAATATGMQRRTSAFVVIAILSAIAASAPSAFAQQFVWSADSYNDPNNQGRFTAFLSQGVPETDNRMFQATCEPGSSSRFAATIFGYNTGNLPPNTNVTLELHVDGRVVHTLPGLVYRPESEEGLYGIFVRADVNDPVWSVLSANSYVRYQAAGLGLAGMNLSGSSQTISRFLDDCRRVFGASAGQVAERPRGDRDNDENNPGPQAKSCRHFGSIKSRNSNIPVQVRFVNRSGGYRSVMWLDYQGRPVEYRNLNAGESYVQQTYVGHPWMITDGPGNCKSVFVPRRNSSRYVIVD